MRRVTWAASAIADLNDIKAYLTENYGAVFADHMIAELVRAARWLTEFPQAGPPVGIEGWRKWRPRKGRHILVYVPQSDGIHVLRVRHERNDWQPVPEN